MKTLTDVDREILKAAEKEFALNGFHGTAVREIAERAGVGKGTVYRHFGNKKELFGALVEHATQGLVGNLREVIDHSKDPETLLKDVLDTHFRFFDTKRHLVEIIVREGLEQTGDEISSVVDGWEDYRNLVQDVFEHALEGSPGWTLDDPEVGAQLFLGWVWGHLRDRVIFQFDRNAASYRETMFELFMGGLRNRD